MSNYTKSTNFSVKDTLSSGDPDKIVSGAEIDTEFDNLATSSATKADKVTGATSGNVAELDSNGNLVDSGLSATDAANVSGVITTQGDLMTGDGSGDESRLAIGSNNTVLVSNGSSPTWSFIGSGNLSSNSVGSSEIASGAVGQSEIDSNAVGRSEVKTSTASSSGSLASGDDVNITLNAYAFFPNFNTGEFVDDVDIKANETDPSGADSPSFRLLNDGGNTSNYEVAYRYITS